MKLNAAETGTPLWNKLVEYYTPLLAKYRARLENPLLPEAERVALCWQIKSIKEFLALGEPDVKKGDGA